MDKQTLNDLIGKMNKKNLIEMIELMIRFNSEAEQVLLDYCQDHVQENNKDLIIENQLIKHWSEADSIIELANTYGGCSEEDEEIAYDEVEIVLKLIKENKVSWDCRKNVVDGMISQISADNSGFTDMLADAVMEICQTNDELEYFADFLSKTGSNYYQGVAASIFREIGKKDKYLDTLKNNLEYGSDYVKLSKYYDKHGQKEQAINNAWQGLEKSHGRLDELYIYLFRKYLKDENALWKLYEFAKNKKRNLNKMTELMYNYFKKNNRYNEQKEMLLDMVKQCDYRDIKKWYKKCKLELLQEDWKKHEDEIVKSMKDKNFYEYLKICLENNNTEEVLDYLKKQPSFIGWDHLDEGHRFSKQLANEYPGDIVELYWQEVGVNLELKKEKGYRHAVSVLKKIRKIMRKNKLMDKWNVAYSELLEVHKKKRLLMKIINEEM